ncbi:type IV pili methyl-accepting chemotaxis transducer N-terminal domain-containing protein [Saccharospirillum salsuginis]|uniref:Sensor protein n=1 Tax=Saccharospirillum salsuginis TaxID=418750 RepID=A0A918NGX6_9GAMM|nr:type IV pili methyl-accepting chemotaxis transducer N-terminal domain-containing protein [Saccharospirillum salsuginis]GGX66320.1 histidine kinase [Saccharospirillum salsuginis]
MKTLKDRPIAVRLIGHFTMLVLLVLASMVHSLIISRSLDGTSAAINESGALRMQAYRIASQVQQAAAGEPLNELVEEMEYRLNSSALIRVLPDAEGHPLNQHYGRINEHWEQLRRLLVESPLAYLIVVDEFVEEIHAFVDELEARSEGHIQQLQWFQSLAVVIAALLIISFTYLILRRIVRPLTRLTSSVEAVTQGDLQKRSDYRSGDEFGMLGKALDTMADELVDTNQGLERRVREQTRALRRRTDTLQFLFNLSRELNHTDRPLPSLMRDLVLELPHVAELSDVDWIDQPEDPNSEHHFHVAVENADTWLSITSVQPLEDWQRQLAVTICELLNAALEHQHQAENERRLALLEERSVLARELHDSLAQALSYLKLRVARWRKLQQRETPAQTLVSEVADIEEGLNAAYRNLRELLVTFRLNANLPEFEHNVDATIEEFSKMAPIELSCELAEDWPTLTASQEVHCLHIIRESLTNVVKHSEAKHAEVRLQRDGDDCQVDILDDGKGFGDIAVRPTHFGLTILNERAKRLHGTIAFESRPEGGADVRLRFPIKPVTETPATEDAL